MKISAVIVNYNGERFLEACVASVFGQTEKPFEVTVIDSFSTDGSKALLKTLAEKFKEMQTVFINENAGYAAAANIGIRRMKGDYVLLLNSDTSLKTDFLEKLCKAAKEREILMECFPGSF